MQVSTTDGKHFTLVRETKADHQLIDLLDVERSVYVTDMLRDSTRNAHGGFENTGAVLAVSCASAPALRDDAGRQALRSLRNLIRLGLGDAADDLAARLPNGYSDVHPQEQLATGFVELKTMLETLIAVVVEQKPMFEEMKRTHSSPLVVETCIVKE
ncbi:MAG: hypothetical protein K9K35_10480 [Rhodoferax sp.]|nr:hypothetical protein [Rhodoferax sp.]